MADQDPHFEEAMDEPPRFLTVPELANLQTGPEIAQAVAYIRSIAGSDEAIPYEAVKLEQLGRTWPRLVPLLWTLRVQEEERFAYGIVGESLVDAGVLARRGTILNDVDGAQAVTALLKGLLRSRMIAYRRGIPTLPHQLEAIRLEVLIVPLIGPAGDVVSFLNFTKYHWKSSGYGTLFS